MQGGGTRVVYCVDTSSLITVQRTYPREVFPGLWERLGELANAGRLVAPREVFRELEKGGDDDIFQWAKTHRFIFREMDAQQIELARAIINDKRFQGLFDVQKETPDADPFVIALAVVEKRRPKIYSETWVVVSDEGRADPEKRPRIPTVCRDPRYSVLCERTLDVFKQEKWQFS